MIKIIGYIICFVIIASFTMSCTEGGDGRFDFETQLYIDTTVESTKKMLEIELDSLCDQKMDSLISLAIDSIREERLKEILFILNKRNEPQ